MLMHCVSIIKCSFPDVHVLVTRTRRVAELVLSVEHAMALWVRLTNTNVPRWKVWEGCYISKRADLALVWNLNYLGPTLTLSSDNVVIPKKWNVSKDCWSTRYCLKNANPVEGPCGWCGAEGMCCRYNKLNDKNSGCHSPEMKRRMEELGHDSKSKRGGHYCIWK